MELPGFSNYIVNRDGSVYSKRLRKNLKTHNRGNGYLQYRLVNDDGRVVAMSAHRLVAICYIPNPESKPTVNHINRIKTDNRVENLEWATYPEQMLHAIKTGFKANISGIGLHGSRNGKSKPVTNGIKVYESANLATKDGFYSGAISMCCNGLLKTHGGYKWSFVEVSK